MALVLGAAGLAVLGLVGALVFANPSSSTGSSGQQSSTPPAAGSTAAAPGAPAPSTVPSQPTSPAKPSPATPVAAIGALRAEIAAAPLPKDRQAPLVHTLDVAAAAATANKPQDAVQALKAAQKQVRDLAKKHTVDAQTNASWQHQLGSIINSLNAQGGGANDPGNAIDPGNVGDNGGN